MGAQRKILILAANPVNTPSLQLAEEVRGISKILQNAVHRNDFALNQQWATQIDDLQEALLHHSPQIVHFSGHGESEGIIVQDENGKARVIPPKGLAGLFALIEQVECVLLNCCYSDAQAKALNEHIPYVVGMNKSISDEAAQKFSSGFYKALGAGKSYKEAFAFGVNAIQLYDIPEDATPVLLIKQGAEKEKPKQPQADSDSLDGVPEANRTAYRLLLTKLQRLKNQHVIETDEAIKFQLEHQIETAKKDLQQLKEW